MKSITSALIAGLLFGFGLIISGMSNPAKVLNFLDVTGSFDPSLAFVMAGAIAVTLPGYRLVARRGTPLFDTTLHMPKAVHIDSPLLLGAGLFGIGWGLAGLCPGPALTTLAVAGAPAWIFFCAMVAGIVIVKITRHQSGKT